MTEKSNSLSSDGSSPTEESKKLDYWIQRYAQGTNLAQDADGRIDLLAAVGGWLGIAKNLVPGSIFIAVFTVSSHLWLSSAIAVATGLVFAVLSLIRKESLMMSISGLLGVVLCAVIANRTGEGRDYYLPGFYMTSAALAFFVILLMMRIPLMGVVYGYARGEGLQWLQHTERYRSYYRATIVVIMIFALRLAVQVPLYLAGEAAIAFLGLTRLAMGVPLYAAGLWLAWIISRPPCGNGNDETASA